MQEKEKMKITSGGFLLTESFVYKLFSFVVVDMDEKIYFLFVVVFLYEVKKKNDTAKKTQFRKAPVWKENHTSTMNQWHREPLSSKHPLFWEVIKSN